MCGIMAVAAISLSDPPLCPLLEAAAAMLIAPGIIIPTAAPPPPPPPGDISIAKGIGSMSDPPGKAVATEAAEGGVAAAGGRESSGCSAADDGDPIDRRPLFRSVDLRGAPFFPTPPAPTAACVCCFPLTEGPGAACSLIEAKG